MQRLDVPKRVAVLLCVCAAHRALAWTPVAVTNDARVRMPGTQPQSLALHSPSVCFGCHANYDPAIEPGYKWRGSMMSQASRDPLFWSGLVVAAQDSIWALGNPNAADLCIRCHFPKGWLEGRSDPSDASKMTGYDYDGVQCDVCHTMYDPLFAATAAGTREGNDWTNYWDERNLHTPSSSTAAQTTRNADAAEAASVRCFNGSGFFVGNSPWSSNYTENGSGQYFVSTPGSFSKRGPFADAQGPHGMLYSRYQKSKFFCQTCHDVSNPVHVNMGQNSSNRLPSEARSPYSYSHVERTSSEFMLSAYGRQGGGAGSGGFEPGSFDTSRTNNSIASCQDCHMRDRIGRAASSSQGVLRPTNSREHPNSGLPMHDMMGGNMWVPYLLASTVPGSVNYSATNKALLGAGKGTLTLDLTQGMPLDAAALLDAVATARTNLLLASSISDLTYDFVSGLCSFRIRNHTGHKLISGYTEGRRMFANIKAWTGNTCVNEVNPYDDAADTLRGLSSSGSSNAPPLGQGQAHVDELVYEEHPSSSLSGETETFHFALADGRYKDNRIPPRGFRIGEAAARLCEPVWHGAVDTNYFTKDEYAGGYDDVAIALPPGAERVEVRMYYQTTTREYVEFLRNEINGTTPTLTGTGAGGDPAYIAQSDPWFSKLAAWGDTIWSLWTANRDVPGAAPVLMSSASLQLTTSDDDGDGIPAYWEARYFGGPTNAAPGKDSDGDGVNDYSEYVALSVPTNPLSRLAIDRICAGTGASGTVATVTFTSHVARSYVLLSATGLQGASTWSNVVPTNAGTGGTMAMTHTNAGAKVFYRVGVSVRGEP